MNVYNLYERIISLCKEKGVSGSRMCLDLGLSKSTLSDMKSGRKSGLSTGNAKKIASYLGVSVGYLLGEETEKAPTEVDGRDILDEVDIGFYGAFKELSEDDKATVRDMVMLMRERRANKEGW